MRPFRFGVQATTALSATEWRDLAQRVEDLGYSTLFLADHYLGPGPAGANTLYPPQQLAPIAAMASAAAWTTTLRVACRVFCIDYHVPAVLAKEAATIDLLSDGRLEFGIGAGWHGDEYRAMGLHFDDAPRRVKKLEEVVALLKAHFSGEQIDIEGEYVKVTGYGGLPLPVQRPHPPILIGGRSLGTLRVVAEHADLWNMPGGDIDDAARRSAMLDRFCAEIGRDPACITRSIILPVSYDHPGTTRDAIARAIDAGFPHVILSLPAPYPDKVAQWVTDELINEPA
jgi:probable F420-dependent oxidoreductase